MLFKLKTRLFKKRAFFYSLLCLIVLWATCCNNHKINEIYHAFPDKRWPRFNFLSFEIPVKNIEKPYDIYLFVRFTPDFQYSTLDFNMIMNTPAGEERINEYQMKVKSKNGTYLIECKKDSCVGDILLKRELYFSRGGILKIEIENLIPRLVTEGIIGVGIRMVESGEQP
jgi:gliding motility-associated lipoprotein GldH